MARWNVTRPSGSTVVNNYEGDKAYKPSAELELFLRFLTNYVREDKFYTSADEDFNDFVEAFKKAAMKDPEFVAKLVVYAREEMNLRSAPTLGAVLLANLPEYKGTGTPRVVGRRVFTRPDMLTEALAAQFALFGKRPIPNSLKKALRDSIVRFDRYQIAKYRCDNCEVKLKDVVLLTHPKPRDAGQAQTFKDLIEGKLKNERTWETIVSTQGSTKESWEKALSEWVKYRQIFALLRNLRNLIKNEVDEELFKQGLEILKDPQRMKKGRIYPYRYLSAYVTINVYAPESPKQARMKNLALQALREGIENLVETVPKLDGKVLVAIDISGSMTWSVSSNSIVNRAWIAALYGALVAKRNSADIVLFNHKTHWIGMKGTVMETAESIIREVGGSTDAWKVIDDILQSNEKYDYIIFITDEQVYDSYGYYGKFQKLMSQYRREINSNVCVITWDLAGYGNIMLPEHDLRNVYISGFSEKALEIVDCLLKGNKIVDYIKQRVVL